MTTDAKLQKLKDLLKLVDESISREEFVEAFKKVTLLVIESEKKLHSKLDQTTSKALNDLSATLDAFKITHSSDFSSLKQELTSTIQKALQDQLDGMNFMRDSIRSVRKMQGPKGEKGDKGEKGNDGSPDTPQDLVEKLESLEGEGRLDKSAIKGLSELEDSVTQLGNRVQTPAKAYRIYLADLTSQCDGANMTFNVGGSHFGIVGVYGTQFPLIYRPGIDYTETRNGFTLTNQVTAPALGQTLTAQYLK